MHRTPRSRAEEGAGRKKASPGAESGHPHLAVQAALSALPVSAASPEGPQPSSHSWTRPCSWAAEMSLVDPVTRITGMSRVCGQGLPWGWVRMGSGAVNKSGMKGRRLGRRVTGARVSHSWRVSNVSFCCYLQSSLYIQSKKERTGSKRIMFLPHP